MCREEEFGQEEWDERHVQRGKSVQEEREQIKEKDKRHVQKRGMCPGEKGKINVMCREQEFVQEKRQQIKDMRRRGESGQGEWEHIKYMCKEGGIWERRQGKDKRHVQRGGIQMGRKGNT